MIITWDNGTKIGHETETDYQCGLFEQLQHFWEFKTNKGALLRMWSYFIDICYDYTETSVDTNGMK